MTTAAMTPSELSAHVLAALVVVILASRLVGWLVGLARQPRVLGEILAGILLGPSLLGVVWPGALDALFPSEVVSVLRVLAELGLVLFMFLIGLELDLRTLRGQGSKAVVISQVSIVVPLILGTALGVYLYPRLGEDVDQVGFALFIGAAMSITAFPVLARVLQETGLYRTRLGTLAITCAAIGDVTAWCVLAAVVAIVQSTGAGDGALPILASICYFVAMLKIVRPLVARIAEPPLWAAVVLALASAWVTDQVGIHAIFGAFMAGAVIPRRGRVQEDIRQHLEPFTLGVLLPVFFVVVGLATRIDRLDSLYLVGITLLVIVVAVVGKFGGAFGGARATGETPRDAAVLGILMNTRGLTEIVILTVGLELGVITGELFTIMVLMALVTTFMAPPLLALATPDGRPSHRHSNRHSRL